MAAGCATDGLIVILMDGPAQALLLAGGKTPDEALGHEARHAFAAVASCAAYDQLGRVCE